MSTPTFPLPPPDPEAAFAAALDAFGAGDVQPERVRALSDLSRSQRSRLGRQWPGWSTHDRRSIARTMDELQRSNVDLLFGRAYRVALSDPDPIVRQLAVAGLWEDTASDLRETMVGLLHDDPSPDVRAEAARALGRFADRANEEDDDDAASFVRDALCTVAADARTHEVIRNQALASLGVFGGEDVAALIRAAYESDEPAEVTAAVTAMGRSRRAEWLQDVTAMLGDDDDEVRAAAASACGSIGDSVAVGDLAQAALDPVTTVRVAALNALASIGGRAATRVIEAAAENEGYPDRVAAEAALVRVHDDTMAS